MQDNSFLLREADTTLLETHVQQNSKREKRKVIEDKLITPQVFSDIVTKVYSEVENIYQIKQREVINILLPLHLGNKTIARVINEVIPNAKATQGSVASMIRFMNSNKQNSEQQQLINMLLKELKEAE